jgi:hypothetical protein
LGRLTGRLPDPVPAPDGSRRPAPLDAAERVAGREHPAVQRHVTTITYKNPKKKSGPQTQTLDVQGLLDLLGDRLTEAEQGMVAGLEAFLEYGQDFVLDPEDEEYGERLKNLAKSVKAYLEPTGDGIKADEPEPGEKKSHGEVKRERAKAKKPELQEIKARFETLRSELNEQLQEKASEDTVSGANDKHASLAQKLIGQSYMDAADELLQARGLSEEEIDFLKAQKMHGQKKRDFTGETHHK